MSVSGKLTIEAFGKHFRTGIKSKNTQSQFTLSELINIKQAKKRQSCLQHQSTISIRWPELRRMDAFYVNTPFTIYFFPSEVA